MTATDLVTALADSLRQATANVKLPLEHQSSEDVELVRVNVYEGFLPRDAFNEDSHWPFILVEWFSTEDELVGAGAKSISTIGLSMGVNAPESWSWKDALHLVEFVRHHLLTNRLIGKKFRLVGDVNWEVSPEQPLPFFYTYATLTYATFQPDDVSWRCVTW